jgi:hypothetical protein
MKLRDDEKGVLFDLDVVLPLPVLLLLPVLVLVGRTKEKEVHTVVES